MLIDEVSYKVIGAAMAVHTELGPGLVEKAYDTCMRDELRKVGLQFKHQVAIPIRYQGRTLPVSFRIDYVVENCVLVELKAVERIHPLHVAQLLSYLQSTGWTLGLIINFRVVHLRDGIRRVVNGYDPNTKSGQ